MDTHTSIAQHVRHRHGLHHGGSVTEFAKAEAALEIARALESNPKAEEAMRLLLAKDWMAMGEQMADAPAGSVLMVDPQSPASLIAALKQFQQGQG